MIGENIKKLRTEKGMTQAQLAERLFVTAQAVSRWENGDVEPSISTVGEMAKIFEVSIDEIVGNPTVKPEPEVIIQKEYIEKEPEVIHETEYVYKEQKPVLGVCEICNEPIYDKENIVRVNKGDSTHTYCASCNKERLEKRRKQKEEEAKKNEELVAQIDKENQRGARVRRIKSYIFGGIAFALMLTFTIIGLQEYLAYGIIASVCAFTLVSCCVFKNNFLGDMMWTISTWGYVKFPGLIFTLDLDGIIWLLTVKLAFWIIGFILATLCFILAVVVGGVVSIFVYPFALYKNIKHPEEYDAI